MTDRFAFLLLVSLVASPLAAMSAACITTHPMTDRSADAGASPSSYVVDKQNDGHGWLIDTGGGFCLGWTGVADGPDGKPWLGAGGGIFRLDTSNVDVNFPIDSHAVDRGPVMNLLRFGDKLYAAYSAPSDADLEVVAYDASGAPSTFGAGTTWPVAATDNGCLAMARGDELVVRVPNGSALVAAALPKPTGDFAREIDAAVGLADSFLVRTYRGDGNTLGALYRVACPSLAVTALATGYDVINLGTFVRGEKGAVWAIDRYNGDKGATNYRLMKSVDDGATFSAVTVPAGFQSSAVAAKKNAVVVAPPMAAGLLVSTDFGATFTLEPVDTYKALTGWHTMSVHVADSGLVTMGAECNYLAHRRALLALDP